MLDLARKVEMSLPMLNLGLKTENTAETGVCPVQHAYLAAFCKSTSMVLLTTSLDELEGLNLKANWGMKRILSGFQIRSPDRRCSGLFLASGIMQRRFWGSEEARCEGFSMEERSFPERG